MQRIRPEDWYSVRRLDDGVTAISEPYIQEFYRCNVWHVRGRDRDMLVDSGMGVVSLREWVPLVTERDLIAVASHTHFDHIGCHHEFECRAVHAAEADLLASPTRQNTLADPYVTDEIFDALPPEPYCSKCYAVKKAPATRILEDGDVIDLGDRRFEVIHTPGHSPGGIALHEKATEILFSGDIVYDGPLIEDTYHSDAADYLASMERLLTLPVRLVHGGHFPSFGGDRYRQLIRGWLDEKQK
ncbi:MULTISPECIES: MBL fold metallo-hydrolase [unclassified Shinella]|uniref:MBL fold metallo-hydrolase n=1 Tax=unclassified Shinella TaxID=2643062 RepID=UPI00225C8610|nr:MULTISPECIES: MBL fold metallo-hydrolase [unclassified Shinella]MCO5138195.1 MBL fold metallo-hydrolase [Shinella sp.]MDC7258312.1 MBL fold metallo-hydrolase [Shinella sp. YE25]CAI0335674.1 MBL fold metallo-hydrolase [Rhizobiaceae bacterium]CAK7259977.1 MBL fold metallo-hydrolase [Shinella sp. WSC3-e]